MNACLKTPLKDRDLVMTFLSWTWKELTKALRENPGLEIQISSLQDRSAPIPGCRIEAQGNSVCISLSSDLMTFQQNSWLENVRKAGVKLGLTHDFRSICQNEIVQRQQEVRRLVSDAFHIERDLSPAKFLLRVDDFPSPGAESSNFRQFHKIAKQFDIPYLLAVTPFLAREKKPGMTPDEMDYLRACTKEGVELALHGFTHERREADTASELKGMPESELREKLNLAVQEFKKNSLQLTAFVAPFNSYDAGTLRVLAEYFPILCGGPESVSSLGYRVLSYVHGSFYVPSYRGVYDMKQGGLSELNRLAELAAGSVLPITLHWANELKDGFETFRKLCARFKNHTLTWRDFLSQHKAIVEQVQS